jgi:hypothetical protein
MSKVHRRPIGDPGLRELSEDDLGALERLAGAHEQQAPYAWRRVRTLIVDERQRRTGITQARLPPGRTRLAGSKQFEIPIFAMKSAQNKRAFNSIKLAWRELRPVALQYTTNGAQARALCRVIERLGYDQAPRQVADRPDADAH